MRLFAHRPDLQRLPVFLSVQWTLLKTRLNVSKCHHLSVKSEWSMVITSIPSKSSSLAWGHELNNLNEHSTIPSNTSHQDQTLINISIMVSPCFTHKYIKAKLGFQNKLIDITASLLNWHIWVSWTSWMSRCKVYSKKSVDDEPVSRSEFHHWGLTFYFIECFEYFDLFERVEVEYLDIHGRRAWYDNYGGS